MPFPETQQEPISRIPRLWGLGQVAAGQNHLASKATYPTLFSFPPSYTIEMTGTYPGGSVLAAVMFDSSSKEFQDDLSEEKQL